MLNHMYTHTSSRHTVLIPLAKWGVPRGMPDYVLQRLCEKLAIPLLSHSDARYITLQGALRLEAALKEIELGASWHELSGAMSPLEDAIPSTPLEATPYHTSPQMQPAPQRAYSVGQAMGTQWLQHNGRVYQAVEQVLPPKKTVGVGSVAKKAGLSGGKPAFSPGTGTDGLPRAFCASQPNLGTWFRPLPLRP